MFLRFTIELTSIVCHVQIVTEAPKHDRIVCSDAANTRNEDFARSAFIVYKTPEKAAKAVQKLNKMRIYQTPRPKSESQLDRVDCFCGDGILTGLARMSFTSAGHTRGECG